MPKIPTIMTRRIVCRTILMRVDDYWLIKCFDQGSNRYHEADFTKPTREEARLSAKNQVNNSYSVDA